EGAAWTTVSFTRRPRNAWPSFAAQYQPARPPPTMTMSRIGSDITLDELFLRGHGIGRLAHGRAQRRAMRAQLLERHVVEQRIEALRQDALAHVYGHPARLVEKPEPVVHDHAALAEQLHLVG